MPPDKDPTDEFPAHGPPSPAPPQPGTGSFTVHFVGDPPPIAVAPPGPAAPARFPRVRVAALVAVQLAGWAAAALLSSYLGVPVAPPPVPAVLPAAPAPPTADALNLSSADRDAPIQTFGWIADPLAVQAVVGQEAIPAFGATPAGQAPPAVQGDGDVLLWEAVRKCLRPGQPYPNVNQRDVGCCVGAGHKHAVDALQAVQIATGKRGEFRPAAVEPIYAGSRVEIGGGRFSGDGSVGAYAVRYLKQFGVLPMARFPAAGSPVVADLTVFSPAKAREWGRTGVPDQLEPAAREHPVKGVAQVRTWDECRKAVSQGYPVTVCSDQGFAMTRDGQGFARPQGQWMHCMCVLGVRGGARPGGFVLNSWGDSAHTGPVYPASMPVAGFWADADVLDRMFAQGDSYALSDATNFPARKLDWSFAAAPAAAKPVLAFAP